MFFEKKFSSAESPVREGNSAIARLGGGRASALSTYRISKCAGHHKQSNLSPYCIIFIPKNNVHCITENPQFSADDRKQRNKKST